MELKENEGRADQVTVQAGCSAGFVPYRCEPVGPPCKTCWMHMSLSTGSEVSVGVQHDHPHGGIGVVHRFRTTTPDTKEHTELWFSLTHEAVNALVALYIAHGLYKPNAEALPRNEVE